MDMSPWGSPFIPTEIRRQKPNPTSASLAGPGGTLLGSGCGGRSLAGWLAPPPTAPAQTEEQVHRECPRGRDVMWRKTEPGSQHHPALKVPATSQPQLPAALMPASPRAFALAPLAWGLLVPDLHRWVRLHLNAISSDSSWSSLLDAPQQPPAHINNPNLCYVS